jgi:hypothetical protein
MKSEGEMMLGPVSQVAVSLVIAGTLALGVSPAAALSSRRAGMENARLLGEAATLAEGCRLPFDKGVANALSSDPLARVNGSTFYSERKYAEAYTLNQLKSDQLKTCAAALSRFGSSGERAKNLLRIR